MKVSGLSIHALFGLVAATAGFALGFLVSHIPYSGILFAVVAAGAVSILCGMARDRRAITVVAGFSIGMATALAAQYERPIGVTSGQATIDRIFLVLAAAVPVIITLLIRQVARNQSPRGSR